LRSAELASHHRTHDHVGRYVAAHGFITCIPNERVPLFFLLHWLRHHVPEFIRLGTGATFKEITRGTFRKLKILLPPPSRVVAFEEAVAPYCELILAQERKNRALRAARDLLLPKLLSGELSVDRIPDPAEVAP
jgi:type I restriction enzyme S subunit